ncbi:Threonine/homoserine/homoserine lactone efflux protein [Marinomonas polaris DSM 16579]|uniref:Threonine/homoserine/homoserine lactone efflux protein n=1 Tax=Marinomonas polaris DSM 16579 TaxID=1122206 RepID=A0A1M5DR31_9GAMM|nr:LysE family translocator [Marinomonas polaris]SHF69376.1 Threonine/homoserine/homoserine lactone efflux protein [Marinomonas polaris DSM 16579]
MLNIDQFELYSVAIITLLAAMSPGPDFAMVSKVSLLKGRRDGILCAIGISAAISVHLAYTLLGLGIVFANNIWVLNTLRYLGAMYLIWLGGSALWPDIKTIVFRARPSQTPEPLKDQSSPKIKVTSNGSAFWSGFACNALNPKTMLFIVSLFSQVISTDTSLLMELGYGAYIALAHFIWFALVACLLTSVRIQQKVLVFKIWIERVTGLLMTCLGLRLLIN